MQKKKKKKISSFKNSCYHQSCDTAENINQAVLIEMAKACANALETLASQQDLKTFLLS
jgi:hypothetical protein